ncbi:Flp pilus assembly protein CpaB [Amnibacterium endophyticum]|uniref:Flp pilus assembly protein CpaB n=1 Tax=Amnibacterium endophyticum TaxID=2109337 RepID=A0ABW4LAC5_9MICO
MRTRIIGIVLTAVLALGGALALTGWVRGADARALAGAEPVRAYVAARAVPKGTEGAAVRAFLEVREIPAAAAVEGRVTDLARLDGLVTNSRIEAGEQVLQARFSDPAAAKAKAEQLPKGTQAVTVKLPIEQAVGGTLKAGDRVGVVITDGEALADAVAQQRLHDVPVLAVQAGAEVAPSGGKPADQQPADVQLITLALDGQDVTTLVWGQKWGTVWLSRETDESEDGTAGVRRGTCTSRCEAVHR